MKKQIYKILAVSLAVSMMISHTAFAGEWKRDEAPNEERLQTESDGENNIILVTVTVGNQQFLAYLYDNEASRALAERLPVTLDMHELNGNEKYHYMDTELPTDTKNIGSIRTGDIMLYGADCLVLFYEDFHTTYSYTRLGYLEQPEGLAEALGNGNISVKFEMR